MAASQLSPSQIVRYLKERDQKGIRSIFEQYGGALNGIIIRIVRDQRVADEVLQDTLLKIWQKIELYDVGHSGLFAWMTGIARNAAIDRVRLRGFQVNQKSESFDQTVHDSEGERISTASVDVERLTEGMDSKYIEVLHKMYLEGYSTSAVAEALNLPLGTVKTRLRTAITMLREKVKNEKNLFLGSLLFLALLLMLSWILR
jgi:RNA polymerase sigma-70 factor (ECF subfamily)